MIKMLTFSIRAAQTTGVTRLKSGMTRHEAHSMNVTRGGTSTENVKCFVKRSKIIDEF